MILKPQKFSYPIKGHPLAIGLLGCWMMNEGSGLIIQDLSGWNRKGTLVGPTWGTGKYGSTLSFAPASNQYVEIPAGEIIGAGNCSIVALIKPASIGESAGRIVDNGKSLLCCSSVNRVGFSSNGAVTNIYSANNAVPYGVWSHVAATREALSASSRANLYVNGVRSGTANQNSGFPVVGTATLKIGSNPSFIRDFDGQIEFVYIYNRELSASEIALLYREPFAMFDRKQIWPSGAPAGHPYYYQQLLSRRAS